ncbi:MAG: DUF3810 domain-containing protein [Lachnospiraceae bacterium]|nr:DUF3810 domain-containing protein [Lachnospiraceae bacterium]MBQ9563729.1 DUF3810 domain-containing protein [Lachnospiraceae bacterium]
MKRGFRWWMSLPVLAPLGYGADRLFTAHPEISERVIARGIYPVFSGVMRRLTGWIPFSLMELGIAALILGALFGLGLLAVVLVRGIRKGSVPWRRIGGVCYRILCGAAVFYFVFVIFCGANYHRRTFASLAGLTVRESSAEELEALVCALADEASALRAELNEDERGVAVNPFASYGALADEVRKAYGAAGEEYEVLAGWVPRPKRVLFSEIMSMTETTGIYCVYTAEANVNRKMPQTDLSAVMAHELSHLQGFMREDEANFIAYLVTRYAEDPYVRYSGAQFALVYAANRLYRESADRWAAAREHYSEGLIRDLQEIGAYWEPYRDTKVSKAADQANTTYLQSQGQSDGTKSYGRMVDLLLAYYRTTTVE